MGIIDDVRRAPVKKLVDERLNEFSGLGRKGNDEWFSELCFCILTANSRARTAIAIQNELGAEGFLHKDIDSVRSTIKRNKHRFHNNKARFVCGARKYSSIKDILMKEQEPREWLVKNITGLGYKEASHFLRNVGYTSYAILDRHVLNIMAEGGIIERPRSLNKKTYLAIEAGLKGICDQLGMTQAELDLYLWYLKTGEVLK
ncbi:MAG: N-glycosylase/DNA lyase [archaeon]